MFKNTIPKGKNIIELDQKQYINFLQSFYNTTDFESIEKMLKKDLKNKDNFVILLSKSGFEQEEFVYHTLSVFDYMFNKVMIKNLKETLKQVNS